MKKIAILSSRRGSHLHALQDAINAGELDAKIVTVVTNKAQAPVLDVAKQYQIAHQYIPVQGAERQAYDQKVSDYLTKYQPDVVLLLGYMRILSAEFVQSWQGRILNIHPSLLPKHKGLMDLDVHRAVLSAGELETGCSVHYVIAEVDAGEVLLQKTCQVLVDDTPDTLKQRVQALEAKAIIEAVNMF